MAPDNLIALAVETKEFGAVMTSSPFPIPKTCNANINASVPELTPTENLTPQRSANFFSNNSTSFPRRNCP